VTPPIKNLLENSRPSSADEDFLTLVQAANVRVERIVSNGQSSPRDFWYDQPEKEWVLLLKGTAILQFEKNGTVSLKAGDYLLIASHIKHRVEAASSDAVWLAVHFG